MKARLVLMALFLGQEVALPILIGVATGFILWKLTHRNPAASATATAAP